MKTWILSCTRYRDFAKTQKQEQYWAWKTAQASLIDDTETEPRHKYKPGAVIVTERKK